MSNFIRHQSRGVSISPNRKQRKFLYKLRELVNNIEKSYGSLKDKSNMCPNNQTMLVGGVVTPPTQSSLPS
jgi:hypothetical protein